MRCSRLFSLYRSSCLLLFLITQAAYAADRLTAVSDLNDSEAPANALGPPLSLDEAVSLSLTDQPLLTAREAQIEAVEQQAIAARQLPDPQISWGLKELPVDSDDAFSTRRDNFTEFTVGLSQDFPRADKRRLRGERKHLEADADRAALENDRGTLRREVALAWLDVYEAEQGLKLSQQMASESMLQVKSLEKDYGNGKASQADWLAAKVEVGLANDKVRDWQHRALRVRAGLARWIGDDAARPLADTFSLPPPASALPELLAEVDRHPVIGGLDKQIDASATDIALAEQSYRPNFSVEGYFAYRREFADFVGVQVSVDLPYFTKNRQDRDLAAALQQSTASTERKRDALRELRAQVNQVYLDWHHFHERVEDFDSTILPDAQRRIDSARSAYEAGRGSFDTVLLARRSLLDTQIQRLGLEAEAARARVRLDYLAPTESRSGEAP